MLNSKTRWNVRQTNQNSIDKLVQELNITPLVATLLVNRGMDSVDSGRTFLFEDGQSFHDPFLLKDMDIAVNRIKEAIKGKEPILIFGDYDCDGVTSTTVMMKTLQDLGANVQFYIPNRFTEGYGPNEGAFRHAHTLGIRLIITVDTGITAIHESKLAKELGMDLIITDHHEPGPELPDALAIIHPKRVDGDYPFKELAGVGVAFKLSHALLGEVPEHLLELVAIGTIADLVSLKGENRLIAKRGIKKLKNTKNLGLKALFRQAKVDLISIDEETIGFLIAPRINAAGRLESADPAVHLLLTDDMDEAETWAEEIDLLNKERQGIVNIITEEAILEVEQNYRSATNKVLVIAKEDWNAGVIGIVASRLVEKYYRPTIVLSIDREKGIAKGSARSILGFDLFKNLSTCRDILPHFGGHPMAAGMTLAIEDIEDLRKRLNELANQQLTEDDFIPVSHLDTSIELNNVTLTALTEMELLAPFGMDNPKPKVLINDVGINGMRKIGSNQNHLKLTLESEGASLDGVGFGLGDLFEHISSSSKLSVIGELAINEWNNIRKPQIFLHDLAIASWQLFDYRGLKKIEKIAEAIPNENSLWIFFNEINLSIVPKNIVQEHRIIYTEEEAASIKMDKKHIVLFDLPAKKELLNQLLIGKKPARIYAHFYKEESDFFSTIPTRDHFKWYYGFLAKRGSFNIQKHGDELAKYKGWSKETIDFMSKVFLELEFVTINNGTIFLSKSANKRDLTESPSYQIKQEQYKLENDLLFSSFHQLKDWFETLLNGSVKIKEEMEEWI